MSDLRSALPIPGAFTAGPIDLVAALSRRRGCAFTFAVLRLVPALGPLAAFGTLSAFGTLAPTRGGTPATISLLAPLPGGRVSLRAFLPLISAVATLGALCGGV